MKEAQTYLQTCAIGFFFVAVYNACAAALRAVGNSRAPLICIAVTAGVNIVLDILFVAGFGMGVFGAALATVIAQAMSAVVAAICLLRSPDLYGLRMKKLYMRRDKVRKELKLGIPCAVQMSVAAISWLSITFLLNRYGVEVSAGNGVSNKIKEVCQLVISTTSTAAATMVAQNIGAMQYDRAKKTMYSAMKVTVVMALCIIVIVELTAPFLAGIFSNDEATVAAAVRNLRIEIIGQLFYAVFLIYHSLMVGSGDTWFVFCSSFINCILVRTVLGVIFDHFWGLDGLYIACMIAPSSSIPFGLWYERSDRWRKTFIQEEA